tara:strand:- start:186 stop:428 length:243 start_codon:yes stop_codon:yes gene_type:complete
MIYRCRKDTALSVFLVSFPSHWFAIQSGANEANQNDPTNYEQNRSNIHDQLGFKNLEYNRQTYNNWNEHFHCWENPTPPS